MNASLQQRMESLGLKQSKVPFRHISDCAVHNGPAYPAGKCDCGVDAFWEAVIKANWDGDAEPHELFLAAEIFRAGWTRPAKTELPA